VTEKINRLEVHHPLCDSHEGFPCNFPKECRVNFTLKCSICGKEEQFFTKLKDEELFSNRECKSCAVSRTVSNFVQNLDLADLTLLTSPSMEATCEGNLISPKFQAMIDHHQHLVDLQNYFEDRIIRGLCLSQNGQKTVRPSSLALLRQQAELFEKHIQLSWVRRATLASGGNILSLTHEEVVKLELESRLRAEKACILVKEEES